MVRKNGCYVLMLVNANMHIGSGNPHCNYHMGQTTLGTTDIKKDLGVFISNDFKQSTQCTKAALKGYEQPSSQEKIFQEQRCRQLFNSVQDLHYKATFGVVFKPGTLD